jgi:hypothetical protein
LSDKAPALRESIPSMRHAIEAAPQSVQSFLSVLPLIKARHGAGPVIGSIAVAPLTALPQGREDASLVRAVKTARAGGMRGTRPMHRQRRASRSEGNDPRQFPRASLYRCPSYGSAMVRPPNWPVRERTADKDSDSWR